MLYLSNDVFFTYGLKQITIVGSIDLGSEYGLKLVSFEVYLSHTSVMKNPEKKIRQTITIHSKNVNSFEQDTL